MNTYQAIYDAAIVQLDLSWQKEVIVQSITGAAETIQIEQTRPSVLMRPQMFPDGNQWCCLYGDNLQAGVAGFGDTPEKAAEAFDAAWKSEKAGLLAKVFPGLDTAARSFPGVSSEPQP